MQASVQFATLIDRAYQLAYWLGFRAARLLWRFTRPRHRGALVAVWSQGRVLMLRSSYRTTLNFPGGGVKLGEQSIHAAQRELKEEVGLEIAENQLHFALDLTSEWDNRRTYDCIFELLLPDMPPLAVDFREIVDAAWMLPEAALRQELPPAIRTYLQAVTTPPPGIGINTGN